MKQFLYANIESERRLFSLKIGFACANLESRKDLSLSRQALKELNCDVIVKTAEFGYDGKGQLKLMFGLSDEEIDQAWKSLGGGRVVIEECISWKQKCQFLL